MRAPHEPDRVVRPESCQNGGGRLVLAECPGEIWPFVVVTGRQVTQACSREHENRIT
ncbi:MAG: hypothetical protein QOF35_2085 [Actinomycetota bacterium]|nr:hypothetical protein [Actinomycetota bacterium]